MSENLDTLCKDSIAKAPGAVTAWWLMASYLYYWKDAPILTDGQFDALSRLLEAGWSTNTHPHKHLIDRGPDQDQQITSGCDIAEEAYPSMVRAAAESLLKGMYEAAGRRFSMHNAPFNSCGTVRTIVSALKY